MSHLFLQFDWYAEYNSYDNNFVRINKELKLSDSLKSNKLKK